MKPRQHIPIHDFTQDDSSSIAFDIQPLEVGSHNETSQPHRHNFYEIFLFEKGGGRHLIDFEEYQIHDRSIHFVSPGQVHHVRRAANSFGMLIYFSREFFLLEMQNKDRLFTMPFLHGRQPGVLDLQGPEFRELCLLAQQMHNELRSGLMRSSEVINAYLNIFLLKCRQNYDNGSHEQAGDLQEGLAQQFKALLERKFRKMHLVKDHAAALNVSPDQLNEAVKQAFGTTASRMITERLLLEAKRLVKYSPYSIKEISYFLNFDDPAYFSRFFKKHTEMSPQEFRNEI